MTVRRVPRPAPAGEVRLGARLRGARQRRGLTIEQVASATGYTKGFISRLERDEVSPSVASLVAVCAVIGLPVGDLFEPSRTALVRAGEGAVIDFGGVRLVERLLTPRAVEQVQVVHSVVEPGGGGSEERYAVDSDVEVVYVLRGELVVSFADSEVALGPGDTLTFTAVEPHTWRNTSDACAEVLWVLSPAP